MFQSPYFAAVDLGSNSFHLIVARINNGVLEVIDREKEMVQIARGLQGDGRLSAASINKALACLARFSERLRGIPPEQVRAVGTKTMRSATNADEFLSKAEAALSIPIQIISGFEEARLVYCGLCRSIANDQKSRLVIDIGGGSTEFIIGRGDEPELLESLGMGCVTFSSQYLDDPKSSFSKSMQNAYLAACAEIESIRKPYLKKNWEIVYGTSGTIRAIADLLSKTGASNSAVIFRDALTALYNSVSEQGEITDKSVPKLRREVLPAGIAVLKATFDQLKIEQLHVADATLKDGLVYDTIGRFTNEDARENTVLQLTNRYNVDLEQANRVTHHALVLWEAIKSTSSNIHGASRTKILSWASRLHEIGLSISHSGYHHHGYYLLRHSDLAGFGRYEQVVLANLVRSHRKKILAAHLAEIDDKSRPAFLLLLLCLRLAVRLNRRRDNDQSPIQLLPKGDGYIFAVEKQWLDENPLTHAGLLRELDQFAQFGLKLDLEIS